MSPHRSAGDGARKPRALCIDSDAVSRRFAEHTLSSARFTVESANDGASAMELLRMQPFDLLVCEMDLADMNGLALVRRLRQESRLRDLPFVFLASDRRPETRIAALRAGVDDFLLKPCHPEELVARCESLVARSRRARTATGSRAYSLAGDFTGIAFPDLISLLELGRRSGCLSIVSPEGAGEVHFHEGQVVHATFGNLAGADAFYCFFETKEAHFEFAPGGPAQQRSISEPVMGLLMEAARRFDTAREQSKDNAAAPARLAAVRPLPTPAPRGAPGTPPDARLARQVERALGDGFTLGELQLFTSDELEAWSLREVGRERLQIHLIAEPGAGISAMLPLGGAPNERWIQSALDTGSKSFGLSFFLRNERTVDLLLLDAANLPFVLPSLQRVPAMTIVAPPGGELLGLGTRGRTALEAYLRQVAPPAVVGCGNATLEQGLRNILAQTLPHAVLRCQQGELGTPESPLRELLVQGLRLWATLAPEREAQA